MDIVYHRNCLDGAYSAYALYLFAKSLTPSTYQQFTHMLSFLGEGTQDKKIEGQQSSDGMLKLEELTSIEEQFFHDQASIPLSSISMLAGDFFPLSPSDSSKILIIVDTSPSTKKLLDNVSAAYSFVFIIDHHSSFPKCRDIIQQNRYPNVRYFWEEGKCAAELVLSLLSSISSFPKNYPSPVVEALLQSIDYVGRNDLKKNESRLSKQFVLGFFYFEIEMTHHNPWLYKRIWSLNLEHLLSKGSNLYLLHFQMLKQAIQNCELMTIIGGKYKGTACLAFPQADRSITSDLGSILAFLSSKLNGRNLAMIYSKNAIDCRISFRSSQLSDREPLALKVAEIYGGGGHVCAAGCQMAKNLFKSHFHSNGRLKPAQKLELEDIQKLLFSQ